MMKKELGLGQEDEWRRGGQGLEFGQRLWRGLGQGQG